MPSKPFIVADWNGKKTQPAYTLSGVNTYRPSPFDTMRMNYALYSRKYWEGVEERKYIYRLTKKIEYM